MSPTNNKADLVAAALELERAIIQRDCRVLDALSALESAVKQLESIATSSGTIEARHAFYAAVGVQDDVMKAIDNDTLTGWVEAASTQPTV